MPRKSRLKHGCIPVVDLFAGPGGLGEGFSSLKVKGRKKPPYRLVLSVECDPFAHKTLELRAFYREFLSNGEDPPDEYFDHVHAPDTYTREQLFEDFPDEAVAARKEACLARLGDTDGDKEIARRIRALRKGGVDFTRSVMIGGPPCQAYSLVGRSRMSKARASGEYREADDGRHVLYRQYLKLIRQLKPAAFVMENVRGILSSKYEGELIFPTILQDLKKAGYQLHALGGDIKEEDDSNSTLLQQMFNFNSNVSDFTDIRDFLIHSHYYGVPQKRARVLVVGTRKDMGSITLKLPKAEDEPVTVKEAIGDLPKLRSGFSTDDDVDAWLQHVRDSADRLIWEIGDVVSGRTTDELRKIASQDSRLGMRRRPVPSSAVLNHETRGHIPSDISRYLFYSTWSLGSGYSPEVNELPRSLLPDHKNIRAAARKRELDTVAFADRFRVQVADEPATTITSHICKDGHYYIHYDPRQCRTLTVREAARLQTFPDDYFFCGSRTAQYKQVGNAVPPLLARQIARALGEAIVASIFD